MHDPTGHLNFAGSVPTQLHSMGFKVYLCTSAKRFEAALEDANVTRNSWPFYEWDSFSALLIHHLNDHRGLPVYFVLVGNQIPESSISLAGLLVHEAVHVFQRYCKYIGESEPSKEFEAYAIEQLFKNLAYEYHVQVFKKHPKNHFPGD